MMNSRCLLGRRLGALDPLAALGALSKRPHAFLLHSSHGGSRADWSFFGADPLAVFRGGDYDAALAAFRALAARARAEVASDVATPNAAMDPSPPFTGGAVGYWAYDFGRRLERLPARAADDLALPDFVLAFYDVIGAIDHRTGEAWAFSSGLPAEGEERSRRAARRLDSFERAIAPAGVPAARSAAAAPRSTGAAGARAGTFRLEDARSTFTPGAYVRAIERVQDHIRRGDIFQANLSQRWTLSLERSAPAARAAALLQALAERSPAPFGAYFDAGDHAIASASPERFLALRGGRVETRPIKGTRPRGRTPDEDQALARALLASAKDRAENVMIVDVLRNDLGRVCEAGSVETPELCALETFPQVHHLTSTVSGRLRGGLDAFDLLHACFPGGSITGAPKIRAMEILDEIEPVRRHLYTGSIGYLDWSGGADWNIAIRTALVTPEALHFAAGGGITADSEPDLELAETLHKAEGMRSAIEHAGEALARQVAHA